MPAKLVALKKEFDDIVRRVDPMLEGMRKNVNNIGTMGDTKGVMLVMGQGMDMLDERLAALGATSASDPAAANDAQVQQLVQQVNGMKATLRKLSSDYWNTAARVKAIALETTQLKGKVDQVIAEKNAQLTRSKSVQGLQNLSQDLQNYARDLKVTASKGPKKPNHPFFN